MTHVLMIPVMHAITTIMRIVAADAVNTMTVLVAPRDYEYH